MAVGQEYVENMHQNLVSWWFNSDPHPYSDLIVESNQPKA